MTLSPEFPELPLAEEALIETGRDFHHRGWSLGTSSNYSTVLGRDPLRLLITGSGWDKGRLAPGQFVVVDGAGTPVGAAPSKPSAETLLHVVLAREVGAGAVLHTHSVWGTLLSEARRPAGALDITGYEMLKGLDGIASHEAAVRIRIFANTQDMPALAGELTTGLREGDPALRHGFLLAGHGLYTWGSDLRAARRQVEVLEFLMEVVGRKASTPGAGAV
ncbi:MAG: methylthioribulose 1-phosphate dehydratase [Verrucomicrobiota bacterium]